MSNIKNKKLILCILEFLFIFSSCAKSPDLTNESKAYPSSFQEQSTAEPDSSYSTEAVNNLKPEGYSPQPSSTETSASPAYIDTSDKSVEPYQHERISGILKITFLDVGQGDSIYISLPTGESMLIDAGESSESGSVIQYIKDNNIRGTIDFLIAPTFRSYWRHVGSYSSL